ncbi:MAG: peroxidase family protein [Woeseiaceae bacterium]|nr:peroxidase family protein [Woeseiaceae bacterium]
MTPQSGDKRVSLADVIVLGGAVAIEEAAPTPVTTSRCPSSRAGRTPPPEHDRRGVLRARWSRRRTRSATTTSDGNRLSPTAEMVEKANLLTLTVPEMTVLVGGMRALDANAYGSDHGVFTDEPGTLTNDFFVNLLDMDTEWTKSDDAEGIYEGRDRQSGELKYTATPVDLIFGSNLELRAVAQAYGASDADELFVNDFVDAWVEVIEERPLRPVIKACG